MPTVQAAIEQAGRMARLETSMLAIPAELQQIKDDAERRATEGEKRGNEILAEVKKTNGSVAQAIKDRDADRTRLSAVELDAHQAMALAAEASAAVAAIELERKQEGLAHHDKELVVRTRWSLVKAQIRVASVLVGVAGGLGAQKVFELVQQLF